MFRLPIRRLSFMSLLVGAIFGSCLNFIVNESLQKLFLNDPMVNVIEVDHQNESLLQQEEQNYMENIAEEEKDERIMRRKRDFKKNVDTDLYDKVRVLCCVMTSPENHETKASAVKETWGKRCNILLFISSEADKKLPSVEVNVTEGRNWLWGKTREAFHYAWDRYQNEVDWFFKADDDTYVIVENLRYFRSAFRTSDPLWFGHKYKTNVTSGFFSGGAGYARSKEATRRFVKDGYSNPVLCRVDHEGAEDVEMGRCMEHLNVSTMDTRDSKGRGRFFPFQPDRFYFSREVSDYWYWKFIYYPPNMGSECCSDSTISFHYINTKMMHLLDFFFYQIRPFGISDQRPATPQLPPDFNLTASPWFAPNKTSNVTDIPITTTSKDEVNVSLDNNLHLQETTKPSTSYSSYYIESSETVNQQPAKSEDIFTSLVTTSQTNVKTSIHNIIVDSLMVKTNAKLHTNEKKAVLGGKKYENILSN